MSLSQSAKSKKHLRAVLSPYIDRKPPQSFMAGQWPDHSESVCGLFGLRKGSIPVVIFFYYKRQKVTAFSYSRLTLDTDTRYVKQKISPPPTFGYLHTYEC